LAPRLKLQEVLEEIQGSDAVYFQPPRNLQMEFPCTIYNVDGLDSEWADNLAYKQEIEYQVVVIQRDPDADTWLKVGRLPKSSFQRSEVVENLYHYYFSLYF
jgi:hypothetical protein